MRETIRQEVNKLLEAGFIWPVDYPSWLANPVPIEKLDGSWRMSIEYISLRTFNDDDCTDYYVDSCNV
jgi:hypothetical protein